MKQLILRALHGVLSLRNKLIIDHCGYQVFLDPNDRCGRDIYLRYLKTQRWQHEEFEKNLVQKIISANSKLWFVDIGASYGMYTLLAAANVSSGHIEKVIAVEGSPRTYSWLNESIKVNHLANIVHLHNLAVTDVDGKEFMFFRHPKYSEWSRIAEDSCEQLSGEQKVLSSTLDSLMLIEGWIPSAKLMIKIDIEGGEPRALSGLSKTLANADEYFVIVEFHVPLLDKIGGGAKEFARKILAVKPDVIYEVSEVGSCLREIRGEQEFDVLIDRCRKGHQIWQIMTNIVFGSNRLRALDGINYEIAHGIVSPPHA